MALREGTPLVPCTPPDRQTIVDEVRRCDEELRIADRLSVFRHVTARIQTLRDRRVKIIVLELNLDTESIQGFGYRSNELEEATSKYRMLEERSWGNPRIDVVLVSTDSLGALQQAYPNYFRDVREFWSFVAEVIVWGLP